jgi:hypothetical protein
MHVFGGQVLKITLVKPTSRGCTTEGHAIQLRSEHSNTNNRAYEAMGSRDSQDSNTNNKADEAMESRDSQDSNNNNRTYEAMGSRDSQEPAKIHRNQHDREPASFSHFPESNSFTSKN